MNNLWKLHTELEAAGLPVIGTMDVAPYAQYSRELTAEETVTAGQVIAAHDPTEYFLEPTQQVIVANGAHSARVRCGVLHATYPPYYDMILINGVETEIRVGLDGTAWMEFVSSVPGTRIALEYHGLYAVIMAV